MYFQIDENSFYEDLLKVINKYIDIEDLSNKNFNEIHEKINDIIEYVKQNFHEQKSNNYNYNKEVSSDAKSNYIISNSQKRLISHKIKLIIIHFIIMKIHLIEIKYLLKIILIQKIIIENF